MTDELSPAASEYLLAFADDEHLMGQQHTEWIGVAPFLEEDLAFCSIAQDELGHAASLYELLGDPDRLAFGRGAIEYRSCHLVEMPCPDWAEALARHWLYDLAETHRWSALTESSVPAVAAVVERAQREETYHRRHADALVQRMMSSSVSDAARRVLDAVTRLLPLADAVWEPVAGEADAVAAGVATATSAALRARWRPQVEAEIGRVDWSGLPAVEQAQRTLRTPHFAPLHARINEVYTLDPTARW
jgi:ring-1,2-phenylacetyl-CoA epoxidase subunit PaaC